MQLFDKIETLPAKDFIENKIKSKTVYINYDTVSMDSKSAVYLENINNERY